MLAGEHAVLHGHLALCAALNARLTVTLTRRTDGVLRLRSRLGERECTVATLEVEPPFEFAAAALVAHRDRLEGGLDVHFESDFRSDLGLGSSAAVTVALLAGLDALAGLSTDPLDLVRRARTVIRAVQGRGSGADAAAAVMGGVVAYRTDPFECRRVTDALPLTVLYSGHKEKTAEVIARVEARRQAHPELIDGLYALIDRCSADMEQALVDGDLARLGRLADIGQGMMDALGVNTPRLAELIAALRGRPGLHGAKISGSGLGDCVIGIGLADETPLPGERLPVAVGAEGVNVVIG